MSHYKSQVHSLADVDTSLPIAIVTGEFNHHYTSQLEDATRACLEEYGFTGIDAFMVPGAFEIPGMVARLLDTERYALIIALGVVVRGDTPHFDYVCGESARGLMDLSMTYDTPIINGILTCNTDSQVEERIGNQYAVAGLNLLATVLTIENE
jgi:6,7-dimethyl-8-ribityllumazine synthase